MAKKQESYLTTSVNYVCEHPYQIAAMVAGTALVAYSLPVMITYGTAYYAASTKVATALASFGKDGLTVAQSELAKLTTLNEEFFTKITELSGMGEILSTTTIGSLTEATQSYIKGSIPESISYSGTDLVIDAVASSKEIWKPIINDLGNNLDSYTGATVALAAVIFPTTAAIAGVAGVVIATVAGLDMAGVIDAEGYMPHYCS